MQTPRTSVETLASLIADPDDVLLVFTQSGVLVGCVQVTKISAATAYLGLLTVDPKRQTAGLGKRILAIAEDQAARQFGATVMEMSVVSVRP